MHSIFEVILGGLFRASWQAGLLVAAILVVQAIFKKMLSPMWRHALWFLVVIRLMLPVTPTSSISVFNWFNSSTNNRHEVKLQKPITSAKPFDTSTQESQMVLGSPSMSPHWAFPWPTVLLSVWIAGAALLTVFVSIKSILLFRKVKRLGMPTEGPIFELLKECKQEMGIKREIHLHESSEIKSPALCGFITARLLLPSGLADRFNTAELRYIFLHELAHLERHDIAVNWLVTALQIVHWFNPSVWIGFARMRSDREVACDALALTYAGQSERRPYGLTIVRLLEEFSRPVKMAPNLLGILEDRSQMCHRLSMIAKFKVPSRWSFLGGVSLLILAVFTMTDAKSAVGSNNSFATKNGTLPVFKIRGRMIVRSYDPKLNELAEFDSIRVTIATDTKKWKLVTDSQRSPHSDSVFDGVDTYFYREAGAFLPGHKVPGDENISYTLSIHQDNKCPFWGEERLLWAVFCSGQDRREHGGLLPISDLPTERPTTNFTSVGDHFDAILIAESGPEQTDQDVRSELETTDTQRIGGVSIPKSFRWRRWGKVSSGSGIISQIVVEWMFHADKISIVGPEALSYPVPKGIGSINDMRIREVGTDKIVWNETEIHRKVMYEWNDSHLPTRDTTNLLERIPPLVYRGILVERNGKFFKTDRDDPSLRP